MYGTKMEYGITTAHELRDASLFEQDQFSLLFGFDSRIKYQEKKLNLDFTDQPTLNI